VCPPNFSQVYTVSCLVDHVAIPAIYAVLQNRAKATYVRLLQSASNIGFYPQSIMSDFEIGAIKASKEVRIKYIISPNNITTNNWLNLGFPRCCSYRVFIPLCSEHISLHTAKMPRAKCTLSIARPRGPQHKNENTLSDRARIHSTRETFV
jgi:hypothetical protein